jgi:signal transduction histidine kinase
MPSEREFLHDLSTPLSVALMLVEVAAESLEPGASPEDAKKCVARMTDTIRRMRQMLDARRNFLKGECHERA